MTCRRPIDCHGYGLRGPAMENRLVTGNGIDTFDEPPGANSDAPRPYIGVHFECCGVYARIYRQPDQMVYLGHCPRCLRQVRVRVGPGGTNDRLFRAR